MRPVVEVTFPLPGGVHVALVYADPVAFDLMVYRLVNVRYEVRFPDGRREWRSGVREDWVADGYLVNGRWKRDAGTTGAWYASVKAIGGRP